MAQRVPVISLLLPTRQRPEQFQRFYESALNTADKPKEIEVVVYIDDNDGSYDSYNPKQLVKVRGPREFDGLVNLSKMWNKCWETASGQYFGHMGDDIVFRTKSWDSAIKSVINDRPKKICFAWCNDYTDESYRNNFGTHGFIHKNWTDVVGRFVPPYFASDYNDTWFNDVAEALGVRTYLHEYITEHMHHSIGKAPMDKNTEERLQRHAAQKPDEIYNSREKRLERYAEIEKLREFINA